MTAISPDLTPTGTQSLAELARRRWLVVVFNAVAYLVLLAAMASVLAAGGWTWLDSAILLCFALVAPWPVLGLTNALLGLWLLHGTRDWRAKVAPYSQVAHSALLQKTAILMTLRNEDAARAFDRLRQVAASVGATGHGAAFSYFVLSDTSDPLVAAVEAQAFASWRLTAPGLRLAYRRRADNEGFKAGNIRDFCCHSGAGFEFFIPLDADSVMDGATIVNMVQIGQAHPQLGILQTLPHVHTGKVKVIAASSEQRLPALPDTPTVAEMLPGFVTGSWQGIVAPARTPPEVVARLHGEMTRILKLPDVIEVLVSQGTTPLATSPQDTGRWLASERERWVKVIRESGFKLE